MRWRWLWIGLTASLLVAITGPAILLSEFALGPRPRKEGANTPDPDRISIQAADGIPLVASFAPPYKVSHRCVVVLHGVGSNRRDMPRMKASFRNAGYQVLVPDSRGHGDSGGNQITYGLLEREDLRAWLSFLETQDCREGIYAVGISMGASVLIESLPGESRIRAAVAEAHVKGTGKWRRAA